VHERKTNIQNKTKKNISKKHTTKNFNCKKNTSNTKKEKNNIKQNYQQDFKQCQMIKYEQKNTSYECNIPDEDYSINFFRKVRWAEGIYCPKCKSSHAEKRGPQGRIH